MSDDMLHDFSEDIAYVSRVRKDARERRVALVAMMAATLAARSAGSGAGLSSENARMFTDDALALLTAAERACAGEGAP